MDKFKEILTKYNIIDKIYDIGRIIDPINKKIINSDLAKAEDVSCFHLLKKEQFCENCISMRAYNEGKTYIKLEYTDDKIIIITAIPADINGHKLVIELIKDVSSSMILNYEGEESKFSLKKYIENVNAIAVRDELTHLYNRRYINERLPVDILSSSFNKLPISLILADLDFFKLVNDNYGHLAGDMVLKEFGQTLEDSIRKGIDWAARFGGEEFLICLPGTDEEEAVGIAERIRRTIQDKKFKYDGNKFSITSSFGLYTKTEDLDLDFKSLIELADKNLYDAKKTGRNKVVKC